MAGIRKVVKLELTDEERDILRKASKIIDEVAEEDGADDLFNQVDNFDTGFYFLSHALDEMVQNSLED